jgi:hypothetical protein
LPGAINAPPAFASFRTTNPKLPNATTLDLLSDVTESKRLHVLLRALQNWLEQRHDPANVLALGAIEQLLKEAATHVPQSPTEIALHERAKVWPYWRRNRR